MRNTITLGTGTEHRTVRTGDALEWPYDVVLSLVPAQGAQFLLLGEGVSHASSCGWFTLREMADLRWQSHLRHCGCEWLAKLAREETSRGTPFTAEEVLARSPGGGSRKRKPRA